MINDPSHEMSREGASIATLPDRFKAAANPPLPTVGRVVHFYHRDWGDQPYTALVSSVKVIRAISDAIEAEVDLTVATNDEDVPWVVFKDVPGVVLGAKHGHKWWWQWLTKA